MIKLKEAIRVSVDGMHVETIDAGNYDELPEIARAHAEKRGLIEEIDDYVPENENIDSKSSEVNTSSEPEPKSEPELEQESEPEPKSEPEQSEDAKGNKPKSNKATAPKASK